MFTSMYSSYLTPFHRYTASTMYENIMGSKTNAGNGPRILHHRGLTDHLGGLCFKRVTGIVTRTNTRWDKTWLMVTTIKILSLVVFLRRLNFLHSTRTISMFAVMLTTKITMYITMMEIRRRSSMAAGSISVLWLDIVNLNHLWQKQETSKK